MLIKAAIKKISLIVEYCCHLKAKIFYKFICKLGRSGFSITLASISGSRNFVQKRKALFIVGVFTMARNWVYYGEYLRQHEILLMRVFMLYDNESFEVLQSWSLKHLQREETLDTTDLSCVYSYLKINPCMM